MSQWDYFEAKWKPKAWKTPHRFLFIRSRIKQQHKDPIQLDLFVPHDYGYEFKAILTNKPLGARKALVFHNGRGSQEGIFAEFKSDNALGYVPTRTWVGDQIYLLSVLLAHDLGSPFTRDPGETAGVLGIRTPGHVSAQDHPTRRPPHSTSGAAHPQYVRQFGGPRGVVALPRRTARRLRSPDQRKASGIKRVFIFPSAASGRHQMADETSLPNAKKSR